MNAHWELRLLLRFHDLWFAGGFEVEHYGDACAITRPGTQSHSRFHD